jgi:chitinase
MDGTAHNPHPPSVNPNTRHLTMPKQRNVTRSHFLLAAVLLFLHAHTTSTASAFRIGGYLPDYRAAQFHPETIVGLTDLFLFSAEPTATGQLDRSRLDRFPWATLHDLQRSQGIRLLLCVGGWGRSTHFAAVSASEPLRREMVASAVQICLEKGLDGLDLDWEHPANQNEQQGYADLLVDLHRAFQPHGLVLSLTMAAWQSIPQQAFDAVDLVQIMAYDHPGPHSTFNAARTDVQTLIATGAPATKLILGLPFYGRDKTNRQRTMSYRDIAAQYRPEPHVNEVDNLYFNGPELIREKTEFAIQAGLAGVMFWEWGQDAAGDQSLLKVIHSTVTSWQNNESSEASKPAAPGNPTRTENE